MRDCFRCLDLYSDYRCRELDDVIPLVDALVTAPHHFVRRGHRPERDLGRQRWPPKDAGHLRVEDVWKGARAGNASSSSAPLAKPP